MTTIIFIAAFVITLTGEYLFLEYIKDKY